MVNHLSDSISIVDVASSPPRVTRTITTCDEPRDIVFAGPGGDRAFVTAARRGQNCPVAFDPTVPGVGRAIVQVWDANLLGGGLGANVLASVVLFADSPRALAKSADGNTVYAAAFHSGNQTTSILEALVCDGGEGAPPCANGAPGGVLGPNEDLDGVPAPEVGVIVKFNNTNSRWEDDGGRDWTSVVRFDLPDRDVFAIDAAAPVPVETSNVQHVGTILFDMIANPVSGKLYVTNTEARNEVRFEGPGHRHHHGAGPPAPGARLGDRRRHRDAAPPEQAHRLRRPSGATGHVGEQPRDADGARRDRRRRHALRRRVRLEQDRRVPDRRSSRTTPSCRAPRATSRSGAAGRRASCSTRAATGSTC